jgi:hypothetical protein
MRLSGRRAVAAARLNITPTTVGEPARFYSTSRTTLNPYCLTQHGAERGPRFAALWRLRQALTAV